MRYVILTVLILLLSLPPVYATTVESALRVVVSAQNPQQQLSRSELNRIFLGKTRKWTHGERVLLSINSEASAMDEFCHTIAHKTPRQFSMYWRKQLYSGHSMLPAQFDADEHVIDYVAEHSGAIGFILSPTNDPRIKEVMIAP